MTMSSEGFPPIRNLPPLNNGGVVARSGFCFQDQIAIGFCFELLTNPELIEVWCETQDDLTLLWLRSGIEEVEFVQVKSNEFDHLWTVTELCKREKTTTNPNGLGTSILERSLAHDRCSEKSCFRMVTTWQINKELNILSLPLSSPDRTSSNNTFDKLTRDVKKIIDPYHSPKGNDSSFWLQNLWWQVEYSEQAIMRKNIELLMGFVEKHGWSISTENAKSHIYPKLLNLVQDAAKNDWSVDPEKKKIKKVSFESFLKSMIDDARYLALGSSGTKLREKMIDKALLSQSYFESALEERIRYRQEVLQSQYLDFSDRNLLESEVFSELQHLLLKLDTGEIEEGINFYKICEERLRDIQHTLPLKTPPPLFVLKGCMHEITDRCGHRYHRDIR